VNEQPSNRYRFGPYQLDPAERVLLRDGEPVPLSPKDFDTLTLLVENSRRVVDKTTLMATVWRDTYVEEKTISQHIFTLRKTLGRDGGQQYIKTVPKLGYRFVAEVQTVRPAETTTPAVITRRPAAREDEGAQEGVRAQERAAAEGRTEAVLPTSDDSQTDAAAAAPHVAADGRRPRRKVLVFAAALVALAGVAAVSVVGLKSWLDAATPQPFQRMRISSLTTSGNIDSTAVSPDGKYVAYVADNSGEQSLWLIQVGTASAIQVVAPSGLKYRGLTFSPNSDHILYSTYREEAQSGGPLYQIPVLGGTPRQIIDGVASPVAFSPDGRRIVFLRYHSEAGRIASSLIIANADGGGARRLATRTGGSFFNNAGPAWSPDGRLVACGGGKKKDSRLMDIVIIGAEDGAQRELTGRDWWTVGRMAWDADGGGLVMVGADATPSAVPELWPEAAQQLWHVSYPEGKVQRITNDLNTYYGVTLAADSRTIVTAQSGKLRNIWVAPGGDVSQARQLTGTVGGQFGSIAGVCWSPDGSIVYGSNKSGHLDIWHMSGDGKSPRQLTIDPQADFYPEVSPDGRRVAFLSNRTGTQQVWTMDADGGNQRQITEGHNKGRPRWTPDGRWLVYVETGEPAAIWKTPADGGNPVRLADTSASHAAVSPDGKLIAHYVARDSHYRLALVPFEGGEPVKIFDRRIFAGGPIRWTADGGGLLYVERRGGASNFWSQPVSRGEPRQLTNFPSGYIAGFALSADGKQLLYARVTETRDAIMISNFR
jgi:Tol biopolymer transport system component/DNA-binding winged helix-turn-helix (wHTH) protein